MSLYVPHVHVQDHIVSLQYVCLLHVYLYVSPPCTHKCAVCTCTHLPPCLDPNSHHYTILHILFNPHTEGLVFMYRLVYITHLKYVIFLIS